MERINHARTTIEFPVPHEGSRYFYSHLDCLMLFGNYAYNCIQTVRDTGVEYVTLRSLEEVDPDLTKSLLSEMIARNFARQYHPEYEGYEYDWYESPFYDLLMGEYAGPRIELDSYNLTWRNSRLRTFPARWAAFNHIEFFTASGSQQFRQDKRVQEFMEESNYPRLEESLPPQDVYTRIVNLTKSSN